MSCRWRIALAVLVGAACFQARGLAADESQILFPRGTPGAEAPPPKRDGGFGAVSVLGVVLLAGVGGWMLWRGRKVKLGGRDNRLLAIDETRPLGNRQYLVVASYEGKKLLLGVCPGRIDLLASLTGDSVKEAPK
ncbi:MAG: flagellar biosynthetic protein FliO [Opitutaceae bacterium]